VRRCLDAGVNYFDTAVGGSYALSQTRYGAVLKDHRAKIVLSTKTRQRTRRQAEVDLGIALRELRTDHVDLLQIHSLYEQEDLDFIFGPRGAMEYFDRAKKEGKVRFIGVTCHTEPALLNSALKQYPFDTVLLPLSFADGGNKQKSFEKQTLPLARQRGLGIIAMKVMGAGKLLTENAGTASECANYVWSLPVSTAIIGCTSVQEVDENAALAHSAKRLSADRMNALRRRAASRRLALLEPWKLTRPGGDNLRLYRGD
jgi:predicted aldo/keto reductase-like oxidoreductase